MKEVVIEDFFNQAGIAGILLADESRVRTFSYGFYDDMDSQQRDLMLQGIYQITNSIPDSFHCFEFQFAAYQVNIYRLYQQGLILMVLTDGRLEIDIYAHRIEELLLELAKSGDRAMSTFRFLASNWSAAKRRHQQLETLHESLRPEPVSQEAPDAHEAHSLEVLSGQIEKLRSQLETLPPSVKASPTLARRSISFEEIFNGKLVANGQHNSADSSSNGSNHQSDPNTQLVTLELTGSAPILPAPLPSEAGATTTQATSYREVLAALTKLSLFATQYLGPSVVVNYWKSSCPKNTWLKGFEIDRAAKFSLTNTISGPARQTLDPEQLQDIRTWVAAFTKRCTQVIRDFPTLVAQQGLEVAEKELLL